MGLIISLEGRDDIEMEDTEGLHTCNKAEQETCHHSVIVPFSQGNAGQVFYHTSNQYTRYQTTLGGDGKYMYAPFISQIDWEFAK